MTYKTILVHLNDERRAERLLEPVVDLAGRHGAHLIGLHVYAGIPPVPPIAVPYGSGVVGAALAAERKESDNIKAIFERMTASQPLVAEWQAVKASHADLAAVVMDHGRAADLIVSSQSDPDWDLSPVLDFPDRLAIESGRPVLVVPYAGRYPSIGRKVMVAWNGKREAARAVFDSLPLLKRADSVEVVTLAQPEKRVGGLPADTAVLATLARHGVKVSGRQIPRSELGIGDEMLNKLADESVDLLVMGAYGHSRFREMIFGGATRHVLRHMTVPTLFSH